METAKMKPIESRYLEADSLKLGWYIGLKGPADRRYKPLAFREKSGREVVWFDTKEQAAAKIEEVRDRVNDHYARPPNPSDQSRP